jgi:hypothetical protein
LKSLSYILGLNFCIAAQIGISANVSIAAVWEFVAVSARCWCSKGTQNLKLNQKKACALGA